MVVDSGPVAVASTLVILTVSSKELLDIQANKKCGFTLQHVPQRRRTYS